MTPATTTHVVFSPGPLGLELEPLWQTGGRAVGCRVARFKRLPDGSTGQAELMGSARPGDVLAGVDGVMVSDMSFDKIVALLLHDANRPERRLTFRSGVTIAATTAPEEKESPAPVPAPLSPKATRGQLASSAFLAGNGDKNTTSTGGSTQPATPSPGSHPRPQGERRAFSEERPAGLDDNEEQQQQQQQQQRQQQERRQQRVMGFLGMGGARANEASAAGAADSTGVADAAAIFGAGGNGGEDDDGEWWRGAQQVEFEGTSEGGEELASSDGRNIPATPAAADDAVARPGRSRPPGEERYLSHGVPQLFFGSSRLPTDGPQGAAVAPTSPTSSKTERGRQFDRESRNFGAAASARADDSSLSPEGPADSMDSSGAWRTAIHATVASGGFFNGGSPIGRSGARPVAAEKELDPLKATAATLRSSAVDPGSVAGNRVSVGTTVLDGGQPERGRAGGGRAGGERQLPRVGSPETVAQSLDTVSLLSEPAAFSKDAKQRVSMLASLWGGGGGRGGGQGGDQVEGAQGNGESEVEGARRLARSLAVKLKERARRCEELEDLFGLRDHQVSQLQRQSNSLAARAAALADNLADKSSLVEALQQDRARLERELAQSRSRHQRPADEKGAGEHEAMSSAVAKPANITSSVCGDGSSLPRLEGEGSAAGVVAATGGKTTATDAAAAAGTLAAAVDAAERRAGEAVAAAEARCLALTEMVDSLVAEKVGWEEERASAAAEAMRLRARARGLEEAVADRGGAGGEDGGGGGGARNQTLLVGELRKLVRERTRELEVKDVAMERLAAHARELEEEKRRLTVSLSAREEDILESDRQMQALSTRLKEEARVSGEAAARAEAAAGELRKALEDATAEGTGGEGEEAGNGNQPSAWDRAAWAEERARLHHNLLSLGEALRDREAQAEADEAALSARLKAAQGKVEQSTRERASLREALDSLRVELAEALVAAAAAAAAAAGPGSLEDGSVAGAGFEGEGEGEGGAHALPALEPSGSVATGEKEEEPPRAEGAAIGGGGGDDGEVVPTGGGVREEGAEGGLGERGPDAKEGHVRGQENGGRPPAAATAAATEEERKPEAEGAGVEHRRVGSGGDRAAAAETRDRWLDGGFEGSVDDLQLDLMEKDIVIEQLRGQLKQLRSQLAVLEEEQAADTAPLQGLLNQLGELKGSVEEREEREQQCRDQVDLGLMRMERLKEENAAAAATAAAAAAAAAAVTSPPASLAGSTAASPPFLAQADPSRAQAQAEQQRLRRQLEDLQWDLRAAKRRIEERDSQLRDARGDGDRLKKRARDAERDLGSAQSELAIAAAETASQRRRSGALRAELQALRGELQSARERAESKAAAAAAAAQAAAKGSAEGRESASATAAAEAKAIGDRVASLSASLRAVTLERDDLLAEKQAATATAAAATAAAASVGGTAEDGAARTRELESMRCALAARDVELESIVDATSGFVHHADGGSSSSSSSSSLGRGVGGSGGIALRCALAAATEARRAQCLVAELRGEASSLKTRSKEDHAEASRLRAALERAELAEKKSAAAAAAATAAAAAAAAAAGQSDDASREKGGYSAVEARAADNRAQVAEDALQKAVAGAQRAWGVVSSCLADESRVDEDDLLGPIANAAPPPVVAPLFLWQQPASSSSSPSSPLADPSLGALVSGVEALSTAYRRRGHALRRATVAARAKTVCSREARRREEAEARAREEAEVRLEEALVALDHCQRHHLQQHQQRQQLPANSANHPAGGWATAVAGGDDSRPSLSKEQEEHLRQIRSEVDRLEDQNRTLRRSLEGGSGPGLGPGPVTDPLLQGKTPEVRVGSSRGRKTETGVVGAPTQRLLFPPSSDATAVKEADGGRLSSSRADCWERVEGLGGSSSSGGQGRTPSPSPVRSWAAVSSAFAGGGAGPWPPQGGGGGAGDCQGRGGGCRDEEDDEEDDDDARARVLEECAGYCAPPQEDGSGGTLIPAWTRNA
eukprot:g9647.t1